MHWLGSIPSVEFEKVLQEEEGVVSRSTHAYVCFLCNMFRDEGWYLCVCVLTRAPAL